MKAPALLLGLLVLALTWCSCRRASPGPPRLPVTPVPTPAIVRTPPVQAHPYEDGYELGFQAGKAEARPLRPLPTEDDAATKALEAAGTDLERNPKWQRGWAAGYLDAWREAVQNRR